MYDVIIIGAGPAGISASLYIKRANLNAVVIYSGESQLEKAHKIDNYYGFADGITGTDLYAAGIQQAKNLGIEVIKAEVTNIQMDSPAQYTVTANSKDYSAPAVVMATGNKKLRPLIDGLVDFEGKGVSYCAICDGFFYRKKRVVVIGNGTFAVAEAGHLAHIAESVTILTDGKDDSEVRAAIAASDDGAVREKIAVDTRKVTKICGNSDGVKVGGVQFASADSAGADTMPADGVFVALGSAGAADFAKKLGLALNGDSIAADAKMATNAPGFFSAGNANGGLLQVCKAVYEGGVAGLSAVEYVRALKKA